ncbi:hypothetical protein NVP1121O_166 [Vibrio phage 1.121.O._10N.286.46.C4]|nr:hypothetical protein NVP1121O_166 [Vibrio phage 1.121.O._10N.286.46.C4]
MVQSEPTPINKLPYILPKGTKIVLSDKETMIVDYREGRDVYMTIVSGFLKTVSREVLMEGLFNYSEGIRIYLPSETRFFKIEGTLTYGVDFLGEPIDFEGEESLCSIVNKEAYLKIAHETVDSTEEYLLTRGFDEVDEPEELLTNVRVVSDFLNSMQSFGGLDAN